MIDFVNIILDDQGLIVEFESNFSDIGQLSTKQEVIGKSWAETFIESTDIEKFQDIFEGVFKEINEEWQEFSLDVKCQDNKHKLIDFTYKVEKISGESFFVLKGIEHFSNMSNKAKEIMDKYLNEELDYL